MIRFENITKKFKEHTVLDNLSFTIEKGSFVAIIGGSGCGKTTTLKMINRLIEPTSGSIYINGENIKSKNIIELRRNMGYVIQQVGLFPHMTIKENIEIIPKAEKKDQSKITEKTLELMKVVGLDPEKFLDRYPTELSGGQQQRVGVARAFATEPDIILMDEPFSALDPITRINLQDELINLQSNYKKTIVFVTHDMDEAIKIADKICIMDKGKIVQYDTPENILKHPANDFVSEFVGKKRIWSSPEYIKAKDILLENPICCYRDTTIFRCVEMMRISKVDSLMVIEPETKKLVGILKIQALQSHPDRNALAKDLMLNEFLSAAPDDSIVDVLKMFNRIDATTVPVIDEKGILMGIITKGSLVTTLSQQYLNKEVEE